MWETLRGFAKSLHFWACGLVAVSQGIDSQDEQAEVLFGVHALVDTIYIKELGKKTHRGLEGLALRGLHTGGNCYGYCNVRIEEGVKLEVNESEAGVVRRIFGMAANGLSLKIIAKTLTSEAISPPRRRANKDNTNWCPTAIHAMLRREMYIGRVIWNRSKFVKSPGTNKRVRRSRPPSEWRVIERPELRIVSDELWRHVQERLAWTKKIYGQQKRSGLLNRSASSRYLFSGIVKCAVCGGNLVITSGRSRRGHRRYGCSHHFYRGACPNGVQIRKEWLEGKLLSGLQEAVLAPAVVEYAVAQVARQIGEINANQSDDLGRAQKKKQTLEAELNRLVAAVADVGHSAFLLRAIEEREQELLNIDEQLQACNVGPRHMQPAELTAFVTSRLAIIHDLIESDVTQARAEILKHVSEIRLIPRQTDSRAEYVAVGKWDLLGNSPELDRARNRYRTVGGVSLLAQNFDTSPELHDPRKAVCWHV
jgi:site-specific DNA recombinase